MDKILDEIVEEDDTYQKIDQITVSPYMYIPPHFQRTIKNSDNPTAIDVEMIEKTPPETSTRSLIAKWWKKHQRSILISSTQCQALSLSESKNPHTRIHGLSKIPMGMIFLKLRCNHLLSMRPRTIAVLRSLSECYHILGRTDLAMHFIEQACDLSDARHRDDRHGDSCQGNNNEDCDTDDELKWLRAIIRRQYDVSMIQNRLEKIRKSNVSAFPSELPTRVQVERIHCDSLCYEDFMSIYAMTGTPVIIVGLKLTQETWTMDYLSKVIGDKIAPLRCPVTDSVEWAKLESAGEQRVRDFIHDIKTHKTSNRYLFDWSLPEHCPELASTLTIPQYFTGDALQATPPGTLYRDSWPSLFVSPGNITSSLHIDAFGSNFWMALFEGRKKWIFYSPEDVPYLNPLYTHSLDPVFDLDPDNPDVKVPLITLTHPTECVLHPGEVLFVPAGSPHQVTSLDPSVAISGNYIDKSNITRAMTELEEMSLCDSRAGELLRALKEKEKIIEEGGIGGVPMNWKEYKQIK